MIEIIVGVCDCFFDGIAVLAGSDAERHRAVNPFVIQFKYMICYIPSYVFGNSLRISAGRAAYENKNLFAAPTADITAGGDLLRDDVRCFLQDDIAEIMSVSIIDFFEIINITYDYSCLTCNRFCKQKTHMKQLYNNRKIK